jgi:hypothetical protein
MKLPEGLIRKRTSERAKQNMLASLTLIREAPVGGYVFDGGDAGLIGVATATLYPSERLRELGLSLVSEPSLRPGQAYYMAELRLDPKADRLARLQWKRSLREWIERTVCPIFTAVFDGNGDAIRSFTSGREEIVYRKLYSYSVFIVRARIEGSSGTSEAVDVSNELAGHWVLEKEKGETEVFLLSGATLAEIQGAIVPSLPTQSGLQPALSLGLEAEAAATLRLSLKDRGISFLEIPSTLYEASLNSKLPRINVEKVPSLIPLSLL